MDTADTRKFQDRTPEALRVLVFFNSNAGEGKELG